MKISLIAAKSDNDPCWDDYEMVGVKQKNGRTVPNCVPSEATAGFKSGPEGSKAWREWFATLPEEHQKSWNAMTEKYRNKFKKSAGGKPAGGKPVEKDDKYYEQLDRAKSAMERRDRANMAKSAGGKPAGGKPAGGKPAGGKLVGGKPAGGKPVEKDARYYEQLDRAKSAMERRDRANMAKSHKKLPPEG